MNKQAMGRKARITGANFEKRVRTFFEERGWIVAKWSNNVDLEKNKMIPARSNRFNLRTCGFPDFIIYKWVNEANLEGWLLIGLEVKKNKYLDKEEKAKFEFYIKNKTFGTIAIMYEKKDKKLGLMAWDGDAWQEMPEKSLEML